jgi:hypothetical protein
VFQCAATATTVKFRRTGPKWMRERDLNFAHNGRAMEILREKFLDRICSASELAALADMLRRWFLAIALDAAQSGEFQIEAWIFAFPQQRRKELIRTLSARVSEATFDDSDPDHVIAVDPVETVEYPSQITLWRDLLAAPEIQQACLIFRMTFRGIVTNSRKHREPSATTIVLCGAPADGSLLLKAVWIEGLDRGMAMTYRLARWTYETSFLEAFDLYRKQPASVPRDDAAVQAYRHFGKRGLFLSQGDQRRVMRMIRRRVEAMDERGPAAFVRRLGVPLLASAGLSALAVIAFRDFPALALPCGLGALWTFATAARVAWMKFVRIRSYRTRMRKNLGTIHSAPFEHTPIDLSGDKDPTFLKYAAELEELGARHICDLNYKSARRTGDGSRYYVIDDALVAIGLLRKTEKHLYFPARALLIVVTEFRDGRLQVTTNYPHYRKSSGDFSRSCVLNARGAAEVLAAHRRDVDKLKAAGASPTAPPLTATAVIELLHERNLKAAERWKKSPYSWGDAVHEAFKVCRREYLRD